LQFLTRTASLCPTMTVWLDLDDLVKYLKVSKSTLYRLVQTNALPGHKVGRTWRFDRDEVDQWIKSHRHVLPTERKEGVKSERSYNIKRSS